MSHVPGGQKRRRSYLFVLLLANSCRCTLCNPRSFCRQQLRARMLRCGLSNSMHQQLQMRSLSHVGTCSWVEWLDVITYRKKTDCLTQIWPGFMMFRFVIFGACTGRKHLFSFTHSLSLSHRLTRSLSFSPRFTHSFSLSHRLTRSERGLLFDERWTCPARDNQSTSSRSTFFLWSLRCRPSSRVQWRASMLSMTSMLSVLASIPYQLELFDGIGLASFCLCRVQCAGLPSREIETFRLRFSRNTFLLFALVCHQSLKPFSFSVGLAFLEFLGK